MKKTGMVRKIDELGRIVIPKEIRQTLRLYEGMKIEMYINDDNEIVLKNYSPIFSTSMLIMQYIEVLSKVLNKEVFVCDRDKIVNYVGNHKKKYIDKEISSKLMEFINSCENYIGSLDNGTTLVEIINGEVQEIRDEVIFPIIVNNVCEGLLGVLNFDEGKIDSCEIRNIELTAKFLQRQLSYD